MMNLTQEEMAQKLEALEGRIAEFEKKVATLLGDRTLLISPRDMQCFDEVACVIGEANAEYELSRIDQLDVDVQFEDDSLRNTFEWSMTPQGFDFWNGIDDGLTPEEYKKQEMNTGETK